VTAVRPCVLIFCVASAAFLVGCSVPKMAPLPREVPPQFENIAASQPGKWPEQDWYREFSSDELDSLVELAIKNNADLSAARARVIQADARARQAGAPLLPSVDGVGNANYLAGHSSQGGGHELDWFAMLTTSYEVDFWGKNRAAADSARFMAGAFRAERDTVTLTTLASVANEYFQVLALRERLTIAETNGNAARELLQIVQARFDAGTAAPVELATHRSAFDTAQIAISELRQTEHESRAALALLLGRFPEGFVLASLPLENLSEPVVVPGLPSELLTRRPDVRLAETNLQAAHADLLAARAAMFPSLSLTAAAGVQNPALPATVLTIPGVGPSFALGGNLVQPIFDHGRLSAQRDSAQAKETELLSAYRAAIIAALTDVENALAAIQHLNAAREFQFENVVQSERAYEGAKLRYQAGSGDYLTLLEAQRSVFIARDQLIRYKLARLQALVGLCKALGGGWTQQAAPDTARNSAKGESGR
jgi:multidrug efflux system outer membrane protein